MGRLPAGLGGPTTGTAAIRIENGAGTWKGVLQGLTYGHMADEPLYVQGRLAGSGDYAGQSAYLIAESDAALIRFHGLIFPGDMPE